MTQDAASLLVAARSGAATRIAVTSREQAYAIQDATLARIGPAGGWKVGAKGPQAEPHCAPLPASGLLPSGTRFTGPAWRMRGIEAEAGLRLGRDLLPGGRLLPQDELAAAFDAVLPIIEVVETRLADVREADPLAQLADLQCHGALVLGEPSMLAPGALNLRTVEAVLAFDGQVVAHTRGGNAAVDVWRMLAWLALHCEQRRQPLRAGQIVTTGSCTGMLFAGEGAKVRAQLQGLGEVSLQF